MFEYVVNGRIDVVVISYKDRLTRFGFRYLGEFFVLMESGLRSFSATNPRFTARAYRRLDHHSNLICWKAVWYEEP